MKYNIIFIIKIIIYEVNIIQIKYIYIYIYINLIYLYYVCNYIKYKNLI